MQSSRLVRATSFDVDAHLGAVHPEPGYVVFLDHRPTGSYARGCGDTGIRSIDGMPDTSGVTVYDGIVERLVRNVPWNSLPIVYDPRFKLDDRLQGTKLPKTRTIRDSSVSGHSGESLEVDLHRFVDEARCVVSLSTEHPGHLEEGLRAYAMLETYGCPDKPFRHFAGSSEHTHEIVGRRSASLSFSASYALNFRILASRAYAEALRRSGASLLHDDADARPLETRLAEYAKYLRGQFEMESVVGDPLFLQTVYAARYGRLRKGFGTDTGIGLSGHSWIGSGRTEPAPLEWNRTKLVRRELVHLGLLSSDGTPTVTAVGSTFLDLLHPDCEDPDVVTRWIGRRDDEAAVAMDTWIVKFFSKLKNRVDRLPS